MANPLNDRKELIAQIAKRQQDQRDFVKSAQVKSLSGGKHSMMSRDVDHEYNKQLLGSGGARGKFTNPFLND
jgi:hypothetical protein